MELIKTEVSEREFTIKVTERELGTMLITLGKCSNMDIKEHAKDNYPNIKYVQDGYEVFKQIKSILILEN